jgi:G3E family GTPase
VATAFFVDDAAAPQVELDRIVTLVDAVNIERHLDDPDLQGFDNRAVDQIVAADRIIVNKIDLADKAALAALDRRIRGINEGAQILRSSHARVDLGEILGIGGFDSAASLVTTDPHFLDADEPVCDDPCDADPEPAHKHAHGAAAGHRHDPSVDPVLLAFEAPFDKLRLEAWLGRFLADHGDAAFRVKGILMIDGDDRRPVLQGVHRIRELRPAEPWGATPASSKLVFIGRKLDRRRLREAPVGLPCRRAGRRRRLGYSSIAPSRRDPAQPRLPRSASVGLSHLGTGAPPVRPRAPLIVGVFPAGLAPATVLSR